MEISLADQSARSGGQWSHLIVHRRSLPPAMPDRRGGRRRGGEGQEEETAASAAAPPAKAAAAAAAAGAASKIERERQHASSRSQFEQLASGAANALSGLKPRSHPVHVSL